MKPFRAEIFKSRSLFLRQKWYFRLVSTSNGETLAQSEGYNNRTDCILTAELIAGKGNWIEV